MSILSGLDHRINTPKSSIGDYIKNLQTGEMHLCEYSEKARIFAQSVMGKISEFIGHHTTFFSFKAMEEGVLDGMCYEAGYYYEYYFCGSTFWGLNGKFFRPREGLSFLGGMYVYRSSLFLPQNCNILQISEVPVGIIEEAVHRGDTYTFAIKNGGIIETKVSIIPLYNPGWSYDEFMEFFLTGNNSSICFHSEQSDFEPKVGSDGFYHRVQKFTDDKVDECPIIGTLAIEYNQDSHWLA